MALPEKSEIEKILKDVEEIKKSIRPHTEEEENLVPVNTNKPLSSDFEDEEDIDVDALIEKASKIPFYRDDKTFTIVASRSHMSVETESYVQKMRDVHGKVEKINEN